MDPNNSKSLDGPVETGILKKDTLDKVKSKRSHKEKKKHKKRKHSSVSSSDDERRRKKKMKKEKKHKTKKSKERKMVEPVTEPSKEISGSLPGPSVPDSVREKSKAMAPMTKEAWEAQQSIIRKVYDEETGRTRLIRGEGEILEEVVTKEQHKEINKHATEKDGEYFQKKLHSQSK